jgi:hypothetical protein
MYAKAFLTKQPSADQMSFPPDEKCAAAHFSQRDSFLRSAEKNVATLF